MKLKKYDARQVRHLRIRKKISGTAACPRLVVFRSNTNFYAQLINDQTGSILTSTSTLQLKLKNKNIEACTKVGKDMAEKIKKLKINNIVFDRAGFLYHGKIKAFCEAIRSEGIKF